MVYIETGRPIGNFVVQEGRPDPDTPGGMKLDAGESWTSSSFNPSGSLKTTLNDKGNGARVVAAGYVPQPITKKPYDGRPDTINVTVKLSAARRSPAGCSIRRGNPSPGPRYSSWAAG